MRSQAGSVIAFLLGVSLTVGFYEGRRLVLNTSRALSVASSQLSGTSGRRSAALEAVAEQGGEEAVAQARQERLELLAQRAEQRGGAADLQRAEKLAARLEAWKEMTSEERDAVRERRKARLAGRSGREGAARDGGRHVGAGDGARADGARGERGAGRGAAGEAKARRGRAGRGAAGGERKAGAGEPVASARSEATEAPTPELEAIFEEGVFEEGDGALLEDTALLLLEAELQALDEP